MHHIMRGFLAVGLMLLLSAPGTAGEPKKDKKPKDDGLQAEIKRLLSRAEEEYRTFFKKPETAIEFWAAIDFETRVGKFDVAALHLNQLLEKKPPEKVDEELLKIEEAEGLGAFLRLKTVREWNKHPKLQKQAQDNVEKLINRISVALEKHLGDPVRIRKFIDNLDHPQREVRGYALAQLARSGERAGPYLVEAMRKDIDSLKHRRLMESMIKLEPDIIPPMLEALNARDDQDAKDANLRLPLLELIRRRHDKRAIPYLWHLSSAPKYPERVRGTAKAVLASLLETDPDHVPPAKVALPEQAEKLYQHKMRFLDPRRVRVWQWTKDHVINPTPLELPASVYEEIFGLRYARQALELDPKYRPAQLVYLSFTLDRAYQGRLDQLLMGKTNPAIDELLTTIDSEVVIDVLERGLSDHNLALILPAIKALGERGEMRAARVPISGPQGPLVRALYYPDRRVQYAAMTALLRMPSQPPPVTGGRIVEMLARFFNTTATPKVLVVGAPEKQVPELRKLVADAGFEAVPVPGIKDAFAQLRRSADMEAIILHHRIPSGELPFMLNQLRADGDAGVPLFVLAPLKGDAAYRRFEQKYRNVWVLPEAFLADKGELNTRIEEAIKLAALPDSVVQAPDWQREWLVQDAKLRKGQKLTAEERKKFATESFETLSQMARGLVKGYDIRPARTVVLDALQKDQTVVPAIKMLATFPGSEAQQRLAALVLDKARGKVRVAAALALNQHVQKNGVALDRRQIGLLREQFNDRAEDANLRTQLAVLMGSVGSTAEQTGNRLYRFDPSVPPPPKKE
ncbi:MAG: hypothetical protein L0Z62_35125 [Gemmataceae bacterium]|nr:hypothetical protein [Gemmataceae bacterium]